MFATDFLYHPRNGFADFFRDISGRDPFIFHNRSERNRYPGINIQSSDDEALAICEVPGLDSEDIEISVQDETLSLSIETRSQAPEDGKPVRKERPEGKFNRVVHLPFRIDTEKVQASYRDGILQLRLPRAEVDKPRKITVTGGM